MILGQEKGERKGGRGRERELKEGERWRGRGENTWINYAHGTAVFACSLSRVGGTHVADLIASWT